MVHSLPALLDDLERRLVKGQDPLPLLASVRWPDLSGWPKDSVEARRMKHRLASLHALITGLQSPLQATLLALNESPGYGAAGKVAVPTSLSLRFSEHV